MTQRVDKKFKVYWGESQIQRISRWYASINGPYIYKGSTKENREHMLKSSGVTVLNTLDDTPIENRKINYRYYISEANKVIVNFTEQQLELF